MATPPRSCSALPTAFGTAATPTTITEAVAVRRRKRARVESHPRPLQRHPHRTLVVAGNSDNGNAPTPTESSTTPTRFATATAASEAIFRPARRPSSARGLRTPPTGSPRGTHSRDPCAGQLHDRAAASVTGSVTDREMTYLLPYSSTYRLPERIRPHMERRLGVSVDVDISTTRTYVPTGGSLSLVRHSDAKPAP